LEFLTEETICLEGSRRRRSRRRRREDERKTLEATTTSLCEMRVGKWK